MNYTRDDLIYLAGLFDGEGCVIVRLNERSGCWNVWIQITNTDGRVMYWLEDTFGGRIYPQKSRVKTNRMAYQWRLTRKHRELIKSLAPFLKIKKLQVEMLLEFLDLMGLAGRKVTNQEDRDELAADITDEKWKEYPYVVREGVSDGIPSQSETS